ncbi:MAG: hypothetical protein Q7W30_05815 [Coriobacteriia bacterium]|nr:hypothetical protein [Coriobacteriia bacterium]
MSDQTQYPQVPPIAPQGSSPGPAYPAPGAPPAAGAPPVPVKKKGRGCLIAFGILVVLLLACAAAAVFAMNSAGRPRDLGVTYTEADYWSAVQKSGVAVADPPDAESWAVTGMTYSGKKKIDATFSASEVSALFNYSHAPGWPLRNMQVRFTGGSGVELSGAISYDGRDYPVYGAADAALSGNSVSGSLKKAEVMGWSVPAEYYPAGEEYVLGVINDRLARVTNLDITKAEVVDGGLHLVGTIPATAQRGPK